MENSELSKAVLPTDYSRGAKMFLGVSLGVTTLGVLINIVFDILRVSNSALNEKFNKPEEEITKTQRIVIVASFILKLISIPLICALFWYFYKFYASTPFIDRKLSFTI